jgi:hypothetical protein
MDNNKKKKQLSEEEKKTLRAKEDLKRVQKQSQEVITKAREPQNRLK